VSRPILTRGGAGAEGVLASAAAAALAGVVVVVVVVALVDGTGDSTNSDSRGCWVGGGASTWGELQELAVVTRSGIGWC
jgi:hypothetical protein